MAGNKVDRMDAVSVGQREHVGLLKEIAFIDSAVAHLDILLAGLRPGVRAIVLDGAQSAPSQIARNLRAHKDLDAVHVISHGQPGEVSFTGGSLSLENLDEHAEELAVIGRSISGTGGLLLWSCETGQGEQGISFISAVSRAVGTPVSASTQLVGAADRAGTWDLDARPAAAPNRPPLSAAGMSAYPAVMTAYTWVGGASGGSGPNAWSWKRNWSPNSAVPGANDDVTINGTTPPPVLDSVAVSVKSLTLNSGASLDVSGHTLTVTGTSGLTINSGATLFGSGVVVGPISGAGTIDAKGGLLNLGGNLTSGLNLQVDSAASSVLSLGGTVSTSTSFTYLNTGGVFSGTLLLQNSTAVTSFGTNGVITGMHVGSNLTPTDVLDLRSISSSSIASADIAGGKIELWGDLAHTNLLASFSLSGTYAPGTFVDWTSDGSGGSSVFLSTVVCFATGTHILTNGGEKPIETMRAGDMVMTLAGQTTEAHPVKWVGRRRIDLTTHPRPETVAPIRIRQGAFDDNTPRRDLLVSPDHALFVDGKLIAARQLVNGATIAQEKGWKSVEYFHIELDQHAILLAEGLPAESYLDTGNRGFFANSGAPLVLHPDLTKEDDNADREAASCAPFVWDEPNVRPVWQRLADRAAALGKEAPEQPTTAESGLHLLAKGRRIRPIYAEGGLFIFPLPRGAAEVQLVSRAASPADTRPWLDDRRPLGVNVARIVVRNAEDLCEMPVDHPGLAEGWWTVERYGPALRRWTNGTARLPLPPLDGPAMLEIRLGGEMIYPVEQAEQPHRQVA